MKDELVQYLEELKEVVKKAEKQVNSFLSNARYREKDLEVVNQRILEQNAVLEQLKDRAALVTSGSMDAAKRIEDAAKELLFRAELEYKKSVDAKVRAERDAETLQARLQEVDAQKLALEVKEKVLDERTKKLNDAIKG